MLWEELSAKDFDACISKSEGVCILPMGVLEKHGDHLPLGTDMYIVTEVAKTAAVVAIKSQTKGLLDGENIEKEPGYYS